MVKIPNPIPTFKAATTLEARRGILEEQQAGQRDGSGSSELPCPRVAQEKSPLVQHSLLVSLLLPRRTLERTT